MDNQPQGDWLTLPGQAPAPGRLARPRRRHRLAWALALALLGVVGAAWWTHAHRRPAQADALAGEQSMTQPVGVAIAVPGTVRVIFKGIGTITPLATVSVKTQINGRLEDVAFTEGQRVHKGDLLVQIDPRPYQALLGQYQGQLAHDEALLKQAQSDATRYQTLLKQDSVARQTASDQAYLVKQYQGSVSADQAQIDAQKLNISYCRIVSPTDGRIGLRTVDPGNYVQTTDSTAIAMVTRIQPISAIFALPEDELPQVLLPVHAGAKLQVFAFDRADASRLATGDLATIDNEVDTTTGTWKLRGLFANTDEMLFPNQFVNVHLLVETRRGVLTVPAAAIQRGAPGTYVYLVSRNATVSIRPVRLGVEDGGVVQIASGLAAGDMVVIEGADRLSDGARISVQPDPAAAS